MVSRGFAAAAVAAAVSAALVMGGCAPAGGFGRHSVGGNPPITEEQVAVAKRIGISEYDIERMRESGIRSWYCIDEAAGMLAYFDDRWGDVAFHVEDVGSCQLTCSARSLPGIGEKFMIRANADGSGYTDNYFRIYAQDAYQQAIEQLVYGVANKHGLGPDTLVMSCCMGSFYSNEAPEALMERLLEVPGSLVFYVSSASNLTEKEYYAFVDDCMDELISAGLDGSYRFDYVLYDFPYYKMTASEASAIVAQSTKEKPTYQWRVLGPFETWEPKTAANGSSNQ